MRIVFRLAIVGMLASVAVMQSACGPTATETLSPVNPPSNSEGGETNPRVATLVDQAKEDLSQSLGIPVDEIRLVSVEEVEWRDSSLGCPQPGSASLTVITPGYLILLEAEGDVYEYHSDGERVVTCEDPQPPLKEEPAKQEEEALVLAAKAELAKRLDRPEDEIEVVLVEAREWSDASLGCPQPGMMYAQVVTPGYQIILSAKGETYDYRATSNRVVLCEQ